MHSSSRTQAAGHVFMHVIFCVLQQHRATAEGHAIVTLLLGRIGAPRRDERGSRSYFWLSLDFSLVLHHRGFKGLRFVLYRSIELGDMRRELIVHAARAARAPAPRLDSTPRYATSPSRPPRCARYAQRGRMPRARRPRARPKAQRRPPASGPAPTAPPAPPSAPRAWPPSVATGSSDRSPALCARALQWVRRAHRGPAEAQDPT